MEVNYAHEICNESSEYEMKSAAEVNVIVKCFPSSHFLKKCEHGIRINNAEINAGDNTHCHSCPKNECVKYLHKFQD